MGPFLILLCWIFFEYASFHNLSIKSVTERTMTDIMHDSCKCYCENCWSFIFLRDIFVMLRIVQNQKFNEGFCQMSSS